MGSQLKFRKRLFVGTVPTKKKGEEASNIYKIKEEVICRKSPTKKKEKRCQFWKSLGRGYLSEQSHKKGEEASNIYKIKEEVICRKSPTKKKEKGVNSGK